MTIYPGGPQDGVKYTMTAPDGNVAVFNDPADPNYVGMAWFTGLDSPDIRSAVDVRAGSDGAVQGLNFRGARPVVGNVQIVATSTTDRNTKQQRLKRALNALRADGTLDFSPDGGRPSRVYFRLNDAPRRADERGWLYTYQFPLLAADPYIYSQAQHTTTVGTAPFTSVVTNEGDGRSAPTITVAMGAPSPLAVTNNTTGQSVNINSLDPSNLVSFQQKVGVAGTGTSNLNQPRGLAINTDGSIIVCDSANNQVKKFSAAGAFVWASPPLVNPGASIPSGSFWNPGDAAVDSSGNIFVANSGAGRVDKLTSTGTYITQTTTSMEFPSAVAVDSSNNVWVTEYPTGGATTHTLRKFPNTLGAQTANYGSYGSGTNNFSYPLGIAIDSSNNVYVADWNNQRIQKLNSAGSFTGSIGGVGGGGVTMLSPTGVGIDGSNNLWVSYPNHTVSKWSTGGTLLTSFGSLGSGDGQFSSPNHPEARGTTLWVADSLNNRVQKFDVTGGSGSVLLTFGTASFTGTTGLNLYSYVNVPATQWWSLGPGDNTVTVTGTGLTSVNISWRDAWL